MRRYVYAIRNKHTERQGHGFEYEKRVVAKYHLSSTDKYTSEHDAIITNIPVQIKCIKYGSAIEMGDYFRNKQKRKDFILIVGFWKDYKDNILNEYIFNVKHTQYVSNMRYDYDDDMKNEIKLISNSTSDDLKWKSFCSHHKTQYLLYNNSISLRFKRDHKTQKRIQCAIPWREFNWWFRQEFEEISKNDFIESLMIR